MSDLAKLNRMQLDLLERDRQIRDLEMRWLSAEERVRTEFSDLLSAFLDQQISDTQFVDSVVSVMRGGST